MCQRQQEGKALDICFEEIERCRPFFLGLLGERYGWIPAKYEVPDEPRFEWLKSIEPGRSITALEMYEGVLRNPQMARRALFYFRDPNFIKSLPEQERQHFLPSSNEEKQKLLRLKQDLRSQRVVAEYAAPDEAFGQKVLNDLWHSIQAEYPLQDRNSRDDLALEREYHEGFIEDCTQNFVGRTDLLNALRLYADGGTAVPLLVVGASGSGKSALLAKFASEYSAVHQDVFVLTHFIGVSPTSVDMRITLLRLCRELAVHLQLPEVSEDYDNLRILLLQFLAKAAKARLLIILDALNQFETTLHGVDLSWLPTRLPDSVRIIVSSLEGDWSRELRRRGSEVAELRVGVLAESDRSLIVLQALEQYGKHLSGEQMAALLGKPEADKPLYLAIASEELRVFGEFEQVLHKIKNFADNVSGLFEQVLVRLEHDHHEWLIRDSLSLLASSRRGLLESELLDLLKREGKKEVHLPQALWAPAYRSLQFYLRSPGENREGELGFFHQQLQEAVERRYLSTMEPQIVSHRKLAAYLRQKGDPQDDSEWRGEYPRALAELPYQLVNSRAEDKFERLLMTPNFLAAKLRAFGPQPLIEDYDLRRRESTASVGNGISEPLRLMQGALKLSANVISNDPSQFASQLVGRLLPHRDKPAIDRFIQRLVEDTRTRWLRPLHPTLYSPSVGLVRVLEGHKSEVTAVALTPHGRRAISASNDTTLKVWDLEKGSELRTLRGHKGGILGVALSADGRLAVSASDKTLKVWDVEGGNELRTLRGYIRGHQGLVRGVGVSADGQRAISGSEDTTLKVWDVERGSDLCTLHGHKGGVHGVALSRDGRLAISASEDTTLKVWDVEIGSELRTLQGHKEGVHGVALSGDGRRAVSTSWDGTLKVWDVETGHELHTLKGPTRLDRGVAVSGDGRRAISASGGSTLKVWDVETGSELRTLPGHADWISGVAVTTDGRRAVSASNDTTLKVWDVEGGSELRTVQGHSDFVDAVAVSADGRRAVSASWDGTLKVWDVEKGCELRTIDLGHTQVRVVAVSGDGCRAVSAASWDETLRVWDLEAGSEVRILKGHSKLVTCVAVSADGRRAVSASEDRTLKVWDLERGTELHTLKSHKKLVRGLAMSADGQRAISGSEDTTLKVWDVEKGRELRTLKGHTKMVQDVAMSGDGQRAISASEDTTLKVWDVETGNELRTLRGHTRVVQGVAMSADGQQAISASEDRTLKVWDVDTGDLIATFTCDAMAHCCAFLVDDQFIAGDISGRVHFLRLAG